MSGRMSFFAHEPYEQRRLELLATEAGSGLVLDVGFANMPNPFFRAQHLTGIDLQDAPAPGYDEVLIGDACALDGPLADRQFDSVVAGELIEHLERPYDFLRDLRRRIAPGGRLVLSTPNPVSFPVLLIEWVRSSSFFYARDHTFLATPRWMVRMLEDTGYRVIRQIGVGLWLPPLRPIRCPVGLSYQVLYIAEPA